MGKSWRLVHSRRKRAMWTVLETLDRVAPFAWPLLFRFGMSQSGQHSLLGGHQWSEYPM